MSILANPWVVGIGGGIVGCIGSFIPDTCCA
jgi:hypothetical protein